MAAGGRGSAEMAEPDTTPVRHRLQHVNVAAGTDGRHRRIAVAVKADMRISARSGRSRPHLWSDPMEEPRTVPQAPMGILLLAAMIILGLLVYRGNPTVGAGASDTSAIPRVPQAAAAQPSAPGGPSQAAEGVGPYTWALMEDSVEPIVANYAAVFNRVIVVTVRQIEPARWNTLDGAATNPKQRPNAMIYRPVVGDVVGVIRGPFHSGSTVDMRLAGGRVCLTSRRFTVAEVGRRRHDVSQ